MADTRTIVIQGHQFEISTPYKEGHTLTEPEARALNQVRTENIRNNKAKVVKDAVENGGDMNAVSKEIAEYDKAYSFAMPSAGGGGRRLDPVEREARKLAREAIKSKISESGGKMADYDKDHINAKIEELAERDDFLKLAKKRVADQQKLAESTLENIGEVSAG